MDTFLKNLAEILEVDALKENDALQDFQQWDSLSRLSTIAMVGSSYGVTLTARDLNQAPTVGQLWTLVQLRKAA